MGFQNLNIPNFLEIFLSFEASILKENIITVSFEKLFNIVKTNGRLTLFFYNPKNISYVQKFS